MKRLKRILKRLLITVSVLAIVGYVSYKWITSGVEFGGEMDPVSLQKAENSPQYVADDEHFENQPEVLSNSIGDNIKDMMGGQVRVPPEPFPQEDAIVSDTVGAGLNATWLGHATVYVEMDGKRILTDPMLSEFAFPIKMVAPQRYNPPAIAKEDLPTIDIVTISHDHYDHLDMKTVQHLANNGAHFFVGIGIKAHLVRWEVAEEQIHEMDWWETVDFDNFKVHCTPARHYSGRKGMDNSTLWTSWVVEGPSHKIFHSGDSGYESHFKEIARRLGPIDIGFIKIGDYGLDPGWRDIHMYTEQSVEAAKDLDVALMFPIHWGTFDLSNHDWFEPINLAVQYSKQQQVPLVTPKLGQTVSFGRPFVNESWWKELETVSIQQKNN
ncbi:MAG: MBL fold metallo-hydrolase [Bacteroidota bacterium]